MPIPSAAGVPQLSGTLIPEVWAGKALVKFYESSVMMNIANTDYEGEIKSVGDTVWIRTIPDIEIRDYNKGQSLLIQRPEPGKISLKINRAKYYSVAVDDIDKYQSDMEFVGDWTNDGSLRFKIAWDRLFLGDIYADAHLYNKGATAGKISRSINLGAVGAPLAITKANVLDFLVDVGIVFDEQNVPEEDRSIVIPAWMAGVIKRSDLQDASLTGDGKSTLRSGKIGMIDRLTLYSSNLLATAIDTGNQVTNVVATHKSGVSAVSQIIKSETIRAESTFGDLLRGLQVCDWEGLKPEAIVHAYVRRG